MPVSADTIHFACERGEIRHARLRGRRVIRSEAGQWLEELTGGEAGIRTLGTGFSPYNGLANRRLQPLGHLTAREPKYTRRFGLRERSWLPNCPEIVAAGCQNAPPLAVLHA